ncbi:MAG: thioredoxin domain-containing protein [Myxococcales bacterium]
MKRLLLLSICAIFAACAPNNVGAGTGGSSGAANGSSTGSVASGGSSSGGGSTGSGSTGSGSTGGTGTSSGGSTSSGGTTGAPPPPSCSTLSDLICPSGAAANANQYYPGGNCGVSLGSVFPDFSLGYGYWNGSTTPVSDIGLTPEQNLALHLLYCSGFRYAFIDISAVWCPNCRNEAAELPGWTGSGYAWNAQAQTGWAVKWLAEGGIVLSLLEQDAAGNPAQPSDLDTWIQTYHVNYPMAIDPEENVATGTNIQAWPGNIILDLSTMKVVKAEYGNNPTFFQSFDTTLGG